MLERLYELEIELMKNELDKIECKNVYRAERRESAFASQVPAFENYYLLTFDEKGYKLSLEYERLKSELIDNGEMKFEDISKHKDAALIYSDDLFHDYDLDYPYENDLTNRGLVYHSEERIEEDNLKMKKKIDYLHSDENPKGKISDIEYNRLIKACDYRRDLALLRRELHFNKESVLSLKQQQL